MSSSIINNDVHYDVHFDPLTKSVRNFMLKKKHPNLCWISCYHCWIAPNKSNLCIEVVIDKKDLMRVPVDEKILKKELKELLLKAQNMKKANVFSHFGESGKMFNDWLIWGCNETLGYYKEELYYHSYKKPTICVIHAICYKYINEYDIDKKHDDFHMVAKL